MNPIIAFVDDDDEIRDAATELMNSYGWNARTYASSTEFLTDLNDGYEPDCAVLDFRLPDFNGIELMEKLSERKFHIPIILLSATIDNRITDRAMELGAIEVLHKPVNSEKLMNTIHKVIST